LPRVANKGHECARLAVFVLYRHCTFLILVWAEVSGVFPSWGERDLNLRMPYRLIPIRVSKTRPKGMYQRILSAISLFERK
jgi:NADH:ubiquinone oxidoreductase subunit H